MGNSSACEKMLNVPNGHYFYPQISPSKKERTVTATTQPSEDVVEISNQKEKSKTRTFLQSPKGLITSFLAIAGLAFLLKGNTKSGKSSIEMFRRFSEYIDDYTASCGDKSLMKVLLTPLNALKKVGYLTDALSNSIPWKDQIVEKCTKKIGFGKLCEWTRSFHRYCTLSAHSAVLKRKSASLYSKLNEMSLILDEAIKKSNNPKEIEKLKAVRKRLFSGKNSVIGKFQETFGESKFREAFSDYEKSISNLPQRVQEDLKIKNWRKGYVVNNHTAKWKNERFQTLCDARNAISHNKTNVYMDLEEQFASIRSRLNTNDTKTRELFRKEIQPALEKYYKSNMSRADVANFEVSINKLKRRLPKNKYVKHFENIDKIINKGNSMGDLQKELMGIKGSMDKKLYSRAKTLSSDVNDIMNDVIGSEMKCYQKMGEIKLGSALTDDATLLIGAGTAAYIIADEDTKEKRVDALIKKGIPFAGAFATLVYCMSTMVNGPISLLYSFFVGYGTNLISRNVADRYAAASKRNREQELALQEYYKLKAAQKVS